MEKANDCAGITVALGNIGLTAISGQATHTYSASATPFAINGKAYTFASKTTQNFPTLDATTGLPFVGLLAANTGTVVVVGSNAALAVQASQGSVEKLDAELGTFRIPPSFPALPEDFCPMAYIVIKAGSTLAAPFVIGTGLWNQTGVTEAIQNIGALPDKPQVA